MPGKHIGRRHTGLGLIVAVACCMLLVQPSFAQEDPGQTVTEERLEFLREEINRDRNLISQTLEEERASMQSLETLERQIALREELTRTYRRRLRQLEFASDSLQTSLNLLSAEVAELREEYRARATHAYKHGRMHDFALVLAAESINQMLIRIRYLSRFAQQRRRKLQDIRRTVSALEERREALVETQAQTEEMLAEAEQEEQQLTALRRERRSIVDELRARRTTLQEGLEERLSEARRLEERMRALFAEEMPAERPAAGDRATASDYLELSGSFLTNRGRLPWPTEGVVIEPYGDVVNPVHGTTTPNPGILIGTRPSDEVRAIFRGEVVLVDVMPGFGRLVAISHGDFKTLYSNFSLIYVEEGMRVEAGQVIGRSGTEAEPRGAGVFFSVFNRGEAEDPTVWLRPH